MVSIPKNVLDKISEQTTIKVLVTSDKSGQPHAIVAGTIAALSPEKMMVGEVLMHRSADNLKVNPKASFLISSGMEAWAIDVENATRVAEGPVLDAVNEKIAPMHLHANALWTFDVAAVYEQGANPKAGKKLA